MFILKELFDSVRVPPALFGENRDAVLKQLINAKFSNKVLADIGLCICVYDFLNVGDAYTYQGDGAAHVEVKFRVVVFRPFEGEVLEGKVRSCKTDRVLITLGFFEDIILPADALPHPSQFNEKEQLWSWDYNSTEDASEEGQDDAADATEDQGFFIHYDQSIRFRVTSIRFNTAAIDEKPLEGYQSNAPLSLLVSIKESGLGPTEWWPSEEEEADDEEDDNS
mmetsp:Transcript_7834/g.8984  ORF Transcript_7834/g.8984 Transcript_7834/m.8984 type:complete len:223 (-) Transcript_7834:23-691(-)